MKSPSLSLTVAVAAAALLSGTVCAQSIVEHAAAAAGATIGTAGGRALSGAIDKTLNKAAEIANQPTAAPAKPAPKPAASSSPSAAAGSGSESPVGSSAPKRAAKTPRVARAAATPAPSPDKPVFAVEPVIAAPVAAMAPPPPSPEDFAKVKEGEARAEVFAALGTPSSRITIPDDGHLIEIFTYSDGPRRLGSVRLDNGQVVSVSQQ